MRSPEEILATLDADGTLHGLPFMPEMLDWCGKTFRVERRVEKTCVALRTPAYPNQRFAANDVVFLDELRCDGRRHDGCERRCKVFWKEAWLRPLDHGEAAPPASEAGRPALLARLKTKTDESHYFCQSTELGNATEPFPGSKKLWMIRLVFREIRNRDRSVPEILRLFALWLGQRLLRALHGDQFLRGPHGQTPTVSLNLQAGDFVRIKSRAEVVATLDHNRGNRGLRACYEMTRCCGAQAEVRGRLSRMIDERTGTMHDIADTVVLKNIRSQGTIRSDSECLCFDELGDCPRGETMFWREIWLEPMEGEVRD